MPKHNPAFGCFFSGPKGLFYLKEPDDGVLTPGQERVKQGEAKAKVSTGNLPVHPVPPPPPRPTSAPSQYKSAPSTQFWKESLSGNDRLVKNRFRKTRAGTGRRNLDLNVVGRQLPVNGVKLPSLQSPRKSNQANLEPVYKLDVTQVSPSTQVTGNVRVPMFQLKDLTTGPQETTTAEMTGFDDRTFGVEGHRIRVTPVVSSMSTVPEVDVVTEESPKRDENILEEINSVTHQGDSSEDVRVANDEINTVEELDEDKKVLEGDSDVVRQDEEEVQDGGEMSPERQRVEVIGEDFLNLEVAAENKENKTTVTLDGKKDEVKEEGKEEDKEDDKEECVAEEEGEDDFNENTNGDIMQGDATDEITTSPRDTTVERLPTDESPSDGVTFFLTERGAEETTVDVDDDVTLTEDTPML